MKIKPFGPRQQHFSKKMHRNGNIGRFSSFKVLIFHLKESVIIIKKKKFTKIIYKKVIFSKLVKQLLKPHHWYLWRTDFYPQRAALVFSLCSHFWVKKHDYYNKWIYKCTVHFHHCNLL